MIAKELEKLKEPLKLKWLVRSIIPDSLNPKEMILVAYVDARQVQDRLDDVVGPANWQDDYFDCKGKQFCKIGIKVGNEWIWKGDSGIESILDSTKGETSDSFKRAAVHWGINRDAYELGEITIKCKLVNGIPVPIDSNGNQLIGDELLNECKKIASKNDSELKFGKNILPNKSIKISNKKKTEPLP